jgi:deoxycytidine triphosphate deaminase
VSTLAGSALREILKSTDPDSLIVTPILDWDKQVNQIGVDLRLGNQFIVFRRQNIVSFDPMKRPDDPVEPRTYQEQMVVPFAEQFVLHPGEMVLGSTFEYISMPKNLEGSIEGRSSWARIGLVNATAVSIDPGFTGCITLELANVSNVPLVLYPGSRIGQLVCRYTSESTSYPDDRKYVCPIGPEYSRITRDPDLELIRGLGRQR